MISPYLLFQSIRNKLSSQKKPSREILREMAAEAGSNDTAPRDLSIKEEYLYKIPQ